MNRISEWFDRHPKTRIALQLALDGLALFLSVSFLIVYLAMEEIAVIPRWLGKMSIVSIWVFFLISIPAVIAAIWLRYRLERRVKLHTAIRFCSTVLEILSIMVTVLMLPLSTSFISVTIANLFA